MQTVKIHNRKLITDNTGNFKYDRNKPHMQLSGQLTNEL